MDTPLETFDPNQLKQALKTDMLIDIVTTGAKSGQQRETEIWFMNLQGRIIICGTPGKVRENGRRKQRDWLANISKTPQFQFCFKDSLSICLPAEGQEIDDPDDRHAIMTAPETSWYRSQGYSIEELVDGSPILEVRFVAPVAFLNAE